MNKNKLTNKNLSFIRHYMQLLLIYNKNNEYEKAMMTYYEVCGYLDALIFNYIIDISTASKIRKRALHIANK